MEKTIALLKIILLLLAIAILSCILVLFIKKDYNVFEKFNFGISKATLIYDKIIEEEFNKIDISTESLDIEFVKANDNIVNVKVYDEEDSSVYVGVTDNTLKVVSKNKTKVHFGIATMNKKVVISLPENIYDLVITSTSGDITSEIEFNNVSIKSTSGDIKLDKVKDADLSVTSGDIFVKEVNNLIINSTSGDVDINKINNHIELKTQSGDVKINDLSLTEDSKIKVTSGDIKVLKSSSDIYFNASSKTGDIRINNNNRYGAAELTINTVTGDITVKSGE